MTADRGASRDRAAAAGSAGGRAASARSAAALARQGFLAHHGMVDVRFGGSGGQGVLLMGIILATAANYDGRYVVQTESYGPEARGGYSRSDVIISDEPIDYPKLDQADLLVALSWDSVSAYLPSLRETGILIYDSERVKDHPGFAGPSFGMPFTRLTQEETGRIQPTNVLTLGAVVGITGVVTVEALRRAVLEAVPPGTQEINGRALARGLALDPADWQVAGDE